MCHYEIKIAFIRNAITECRDHAAVNKYSKHHQYQLAAAYELFEDIIYNTVKSDELFQEKNS